MKGTPLQPRELSSTTTEVDKKLEIKERNHLFNHVDKLASEHHVRVSNTMIKVTYKKALRDENDYAVGERTILSKSMSHTEGRKSSHVGGGERSPKPRAFAQHSGPRPQTVTERQKRYVNGVDLSARSGDGTGHPGKERRVLSPPGGGGSSSKRPKTSPAKGTKKSEAGGKRFLKNGDKLVRAKGSIIQRNGGDAKTGNKNSRVTKKIGNGVKKKADVDKKGLKRKASSTEVNEVAKKVKTNRRRSKEGGEGEAVKKPIMEVDPDLPAGWSRYIRTKNEGTANEQYVVYVVSPQGKKFRFKWQLRKFLEQTKSSLDVDRFFFGLYRRRGSSKTGGSSDSGKGLEEKKLLLFDPNLPFGWRRVIRTNASNGRKQVHIISPDGKIFRRRYRLYKYLTKHQYDHNLDRFHFGLYAKKEEASDCPPGRGSEDGAPASGKSNGAADEPESEMFNSCISKNQNLPDGWKRSIRIRSSRGRPRRMEVVIVSPDGRRHRSKQDLEQYLRQLDSKYRAEDFGFGKSGSKNSDSSPERQAESEPEHEPGTGSNVLNVLNTKRKSGSEPLEENKISPEGGMTDSVNALMMSCGLSSPRKVRRQRLPRDEHEEQVKRPENAEEDASPDEIPTHWIQRLVKCRTDLRTLEPEAASAIGKAAKEFLKKFSSLALSGSKEPERGLTYEDLADLVSRSEGLSPLRTLIPRKITYREYIKLNRPQRYWTFA